MIFKLDSIQKKAILCVYSSDVVNFLLKFYGVKTLVRGFCFVLV